MTGCAGDSGRPRGTLRLLVDPKFGLIAWGKFITLSAYWMHTVVITMLVYEQTGSTLTVAAVVAAQLAPQLILGPLAGSLVDRGYAVVQVVAGRCVAAIGTGAFAAWHQYHTSADHRTLSAALASSLIVGVGFAFGGPALQSMVPALVRAEELPVAMALNSAPLTVSAVIGPALGAYVSARWGITVTLIAVACAQIAFAAAVLLARLPIRRTAAAGADLSMMVALRFTVRDRALVVLLIAIAAMGFGAEPSVTLAPALAHELNAPANTVGVITGSFGIGAACGLLVFGRSERRFGTGWLSVAGAVLNGAGLLLVALAPSVSMTAAGFAISGCGFSWATSALGTLVQQRAPDHLRGRIMALWVMATLGVRPLAAALEGLVADLASVRTAVGVSAAVGAAVAVLVRPRPSVVPKINPVTAAGQEAPRSSLPVPTDSDESG